MLPELQRDEVRDHTEDARSARSGQNPHWAGEPVPSVGKRGVRKSGFQKLQ